MSIDIDLPQLRRPEEIRLMSGTCLAEDPVHVPFVLQRVRHTERPGLFLVLRVDYGAEAADLRPMEGVSRAILLNVPFQLLRAENSGETATPVHSVRVRVARGSPVGQKSDDADDL